MNEEQLPPVTACTADVAVWSSVCLTKGKSRDRTSFNYLSDILHVCPGVLLQQKELVPHPTSLGAPERNSVGVLSCQPRGPPPPPCSPPQGPEAVPWRAEVGHGPHRHQRANFPPIHGHTATTFCLLPPSVVRVQLFLVRVSAQSSCCNLLKQERLLRLTQGGKQHLEGLHRKAECQYWEGRQQFVSAQALVLFHDLQSGPTRLGFLKMRYF